MNKFLISTLATALFLSAGSASALTLKTGQVIGGDGAIYDGASPEQIEMLIKRAQDGGKSVGVSGGNVFVVVGEQVTFVPTSALQGKNNDQVKNIVKVAVASDIGDLDINIEELDDEVLASQEEIDALIETSLNSDIFTGLESELREQLNDISAADLQGIADEIERVTAAEQAAIAECESVSGPGTCG